MVGNMAWNVLRRPLHRRHSSMGPMMTVNSAVEAKGLQAQQGSCHTLFADADQRCHSAMAQ